VREANFRFTHLAQAAEDRTCGTPSGVAPRPLPSVLLAPSATIGATVNAQRLKIVQTVFDEQMWITCVCLITSFSFGHPLVIKKPRFPGAFYISAERIKFP
jgi:hypothetical protein